MFACTCAHGGDGVLLLVGDERAGQDLQLPQAGPHVLGAVVLALQAHVALERGHQGGGVGLHQTGHEHHLRVHHHGANGGPDAAGGWRQKVTCRESAAQLLPSAT